MLILALVEWLDKAFNIIIIIIIGGTGLWALGLTLARQVLLLLQPLHQFSNIIKRDPKKPR
jgi:hypothetical protein